MINKKKTLAISSAVIVFCIIMAIIDGVFKADYFIKSAIKLVLFLALPLIYSYFNKDIQARDLFKFDKKGIKLALCLCIPVYIVIVGGYFLLRGIFDFSAITSSLTNNIGVQKDNFIFVSLYISFVISLLEEFFFRGFAFLSLKKISGRPFAYIFSASAFAVYHVAMMIGWFSIGAFLLVMLGLFAGGIIFNYLNEKSETVYPSWFVHMFANFAINTVGFILFEII